MASRPQGESVLDQRDIDHWVGRFTDEVNRVGTATQDQSGADARTWTSGIFECFNPIDTCLITWCLPCVTFGKTHHRTHKEGSMEGYSAVNTSCLLFAGSHCCALSWIPTFLQRADIRRKNNLQGSCISDFLLSCCCMCCSIVQTEKETEALLANAAINTQYKADERMQYSS